MKLLCWLLILKYLPMKLRNDKICKEMILEKENFEDELLKLIDFSECNLTK
jgi:hypothetical protein